MKKLLLCIGIFSLFLITGCSSENENVSLKLDELSTKLDTLKGESFDRFTASEIVSTKIEGLVEVYEYDFEEKFKLNVEDIQEYSIAINEETLDMYFFVKPLEGKKDSVKEAIDNYLESVEKTPSYEEHLGYLLYVVAEDSDNLLKEIKDCKGQIFGALMQLDDDMLSQQLGIEKDMVEEYLIKVPMMITNSHTYAIIKPSEGKKADVKEKMDTYMKNLETQWETYLPDQYELVKNRLVEEYGDYLIYIVSSDNEIVFNAIKDANQK